MSSIKIHNLTRREDAEPLRRLLEGKTFMKLEVGLAPVGGSFDVLVSTRRPDTSEEELREMVLSVLATAVLDMGSPAVLRALAEGCNRLNDGDPNDIRAARLADARVLEHFGQVRRGTAHEPKEEASHGYIALEGQRLGRYAWVNGLGWWVHDAGRNRVEPGTVLYADPECTVAIRTV